MSRCFPSALTPWCRSRSVPRNSCRRSSACCAARRSEMSPIDRAARHAPLLIVYLDRDLRVQFANTRCDELLGHPAEALRGRLLAELVDAGTLRYALEHAAEVERGNAEPREYLLCDREGARR